MSFKLGFSKAKQHTARQKPKATTLSSNYSYVSGHFKNSTYKYHIFNPVDFEPAKNDLKICRRSNLQLAITSPGKKTSS